MNFVSMKCKNCGAQLNLNLDNLAVYCPHCGNKLMLDVSEIQDLLREKEITKRHQAELDADFRLEKFKKEENRKDFRYSIGILLIMLFASFLLLGTGILLSLR